MLAPAWVRAGKLAGSVAASLTISRSPPRNSAGKSRMVRPESRACTGSTTNKRVASSGCGFMASPPSCDFHARAVGCRRGGDDHVDDVLCDFFWCCERLAIGIGHGGSMHARVHFARIDREYAD